MNWTLVGLSVVAAFVIVGVCLAYLGHLIETSISDPFDD